MTLTVAFPWVPFPSPVSHRTWRVSWERSSIRYSLTPSLKHRSQTQHLCFSWSYPQSACKEGTVSLLASRPALPSKTKGPALFLGVRGPSPAVMSSVFGEAVLVGSGCKLLPNVPLSRRPGISMALTDAICGDAGFDPRRRARRPGLTTSRGGVRWIMAGAGDASITIASSDCCALSSIICTVSS